MGLVTAALLLAAGAGAPACAASRAAARPAPARAVPVSAPPLSLPAAGLGALSPASAVLAAAAPAGAPGRALPAAPAASDAAAPAAARASLEGMPDAPSAAAFFDGSAAAPASSWLGRLAAGLRGPPAGWVRSEPSRGMLYHGTSWSAVLGMVRSGKGLDAGGGLAVGPGEARSYARRRARASGSKAVLLEFSPGAVRDRVSWVLDFYVVDRALPLSALTEASKDALLAELEAGAASRSAREQEALRRAFLRAFGRL